MKAFFGFWPITGPKHALEKNLASEKYIKKTRDLFLFQQNPSSLRILSSLSYSLKSKNPKNLQNQKNFLKIKIISQWLQNFCNLLYGSWIFFFKQKKCNSIYLIASLIANMVFGPFIYLQVCFCLLKIEERSRMQKEMSLIKSYQNWVDFEKGSFFFS